MHVDDSLGAKNFAAETRDAVFAKLDHWQQIGESQPWNGVWLISRLHVNHISRTNDVAHAAAGAFLDLNVLDHRTSLLRRLPSLGADRRY
jgi:hypothetical protein